MTIVRKVVSGEVESCREEEVSCEVESCREEEVSCEVESWRGDEVPGEVEVVGKTRFQVRLKLKGRRGFG